MRFSPKQLDRESSEPLYLQVFRILRAEITGTAADLYILFLIYHLS